MLAYLVGIRNIASRNRRSTKADQIGSSRHLGAHPPPPHIAIETLLGRCEAILLSPRDDRIVLRITRHIGIVPLRVVLINLADTRLLLADAVKVADVRKRDLLSLHIVVIVLESAALVRNRCGDHDLIRVD